MPLDRRRYSTDQILSWVCVAKPLLARIDTRRQLPACVLALFCGPPRATRPDRRRARASCLCRRTGNSSASTSRQTCRAGGNAATVCQAIAGSLRVVASVPDLGVGERHGGISGWRRVAMRLIPPKIPPDTTSCTRVEPDHPGKKKPRKSLTLRGFSEYCGSCRNNFWCPGPDSNRHALRRGILSPLRLPVSPPGLVGIALIFPCANAAQRCGKRELWPKSRSRASCRLACRHRRHSQTVRENRASVCWPR